MSPFIWIVLFYAYFCTPQKGKRSDSVAQLVEQYTFNVWVLGSSPSGITKLRRKSGLFLCKAAKQACLIERMSMKKAKATRCVALRSFGLDQFVGKSDEQSEDDNPIIELRGEVGRAKRGRQSHN